MQDLLFELLQVTVGTRTSLSRVPSGIEWSALYEDAQRQAVDSIILEGIERLPDNQRPQKMILLQWIGTGELLKQKNQLLNKSCIELQAIFSNNGYRSCILKGQGNALLYTNPLLRQCGDIDIWVEGDRDLILGFLRMKGDVGSVDVKHCDWEILQDVPVEVHFIPTWFYNPFVNKRLQRWFEKQQSNQFKNVSEMGFTRPTILFNLVYVLIHIYRHLFDEGVGLRQLMDYYYVLQHSTLDERQEAYRVLCSFNMKRFVGAVLFVLQEVFKLDDGFLLCKPLPKDGQFLLKEIMLAGNFGHYDVRNHRQKGRFANGIENIRRNLRFVGRYPQEVCWIPAWKIWHWCWRKRKGFL
jgi:hypothetical protein